MTALAAGATAARGRAAVEAEGCGRSSSSIFLEQPLEREFTPFFYK